jgi:AcrR family transcriptional regulator
MTDVKGEPSLRAQQAAHTRRRILAAAGEVLAEQGFAGARIEDVAARAGVAVPTVYKGFAHKRNLLVSAVHQAMTGGDEGAVDEQAWFAEQLAEPDPVGQLQLVARNARRMYERSAPLLNVLRASAPLDAELTNAWEEIVARRLDRSRKTARSLRTKAGRRARLSVGSTAVTLYVLTEPELFTTFMATGSSADQYERWLSDLLCRSLLD